LRERLVPCSVRERHPSALQHQRMVAMQKRGRKNVAKRPFGPSTPFAIVRCRNKRTPPFADGVPYRVGVPLIKIYKWAWPTKKVAVIVD